MKKPNITTGPWTPDTGKFAYGDFPVVMAPGATLVCSMSSPFEEGKANAQAIAALPKLLEALENALEEAENCEESLEGLIGLKNYILDMVPPALLAAGYTE